MKRKLIKQGLGGYTIYLPAKWVKSRGLNNKDSIDLEESGDKIILSSKALKKKEITKDIKNLSESELLVLLGHIYRNGYDKITLLNAENNASAIRKIVSDLLLGFEIVEIKKETMVLENIAEPSGEQYESLIRRIFLINKELYSLGIEIMNGAGSFNAAKELRKDQDKLILFCKRLIMKRKIEHDPVLDWELLTFLMHIGHNIYYICEYSEKNSVNARDVLKKASDYYENFYLAYFKSDIKLIEKINKEKTKLQYTLIEDNFDKDSKKSMLLSLIRENLRIVQISTSPVLSLLLTVQTDNS